MHPIEEDKEAEQAGKSYGLLICYRQFANKRHGRKVHYIRRTGTLYLSRLPKNPDNPAKMNAFGSFVWLVCWSMNSTTPRVAFILSGTSSTSIYGNMLTSPEFLCNLYSMSQA